MAYEISVGPDQLTINIGECVLLTESSGQIFQPSERGLFYRDTRLVSGWAITVNGRAWQPVSSAATAHFAAQVVMTNPELPADGADTPSGSISLTLSRLLGLGGLRETLVLRNHNLRAVRLSLAINMQCDFADIFDVKSKRIVSRGATTTRWDADAGQLETIHVNGSFRRGILIAPARDAPKPVLRDGELCFVVELNAQAIWSADLSYRVIDGDTLLDAPHAAFAERESSDQASALKKWRSQAMRLRTPHASLQQLYDQSLADLAALRARTWRPSYPPQAFLGLPPCSGATASSPPCRQWRSTPTSHAALLKFWPAIRRSKPTTRATYSQARFRMSCGAASCRNSASGPIGRTMGLRTQPRSTSCCFTKHGASQETMA